MESLFMFCTIILSLCLCNSLYAMHNDEDGLNLPLPPLYESLLINDDKFSTNSDIISSSSINIYTDEHSDSIDTNTGRSSAFMLEKVMGGYKCPISKECKTIRGRKKANVLSHTARKHARCPCDSTFEFTSKEELINHVKQHESTAFIVKDLLRHRHKILEPKKDKPRPRCPICDKTLSSTRSLNMHMISIHKDDLINHITSHPHKSLYV